MTQSVLVLAQAGPRMQALQACALRLGEGWSVRTVPPDAPAALLGAWPALVVLDVEGEEPALLVQRIARQFEGTPLVASADDDDQRLVSAVLDAGALSFLPRAYTAEQGALILRLAIDGVGHRPHGAHRLEPGIASTQSIDPAAAQPGSSLHALRLTPKQVEVLSYAAEGRSNKQIAARLDISVGTVKLHLTEIYRRLNVDRRGEAIALAQQLQRVRAQQIQRGEDGKDVLDWLLPHVNHRQLPRDAVIFRRGDPGTELYYLQRGTVKLEEIGVEMNAGDMFGEIGLFAPDHARTCTARCSTDVDLFCLSSEQVKSIYYLNPRFALHLITLVARRLLADRDRAG